MTVDFTKNNGLVPAIVQDARTGCVLMLGYMNQEALAKTKAEGKVTFFSRSKNRLWTKGETSGNTLELVDIRSDCDGDALLIKANPTGPVCHTGQDTCFNEINRGKAANTFLQHLQEVIRRRRQQPKTTSYTSSLFQSGLQRIAQKVGEEAVEVVLEAREADSGRLLEESADLLYHLLVLWEARSVSLAEVIEVLEKRHKS